MDIQALIAKAEKDCAPVFAALEALDSIEVLGSLRSTLRFPGIRTASAVYVGDSDVDIETAHNAGIPCISVLWGFRDKDFLLQHGAKTFISAPQELLEIPRTT